jgi:hypothetical protein
LPQAHARLGTRVGRLLNEPPDFRCVGAKRYEDVERLIPAAAGIALIAFVETVAIGRTFAKLHR